MRVYKFLDSRLALKSLSEKRLKISKLEELNDSFELIPCNPQQPKTEMGSSAHEGGILGKIAACFVFSASWRDPVLWAHYADKHRGIWLSGQWRELLN